MFLRVGGRFQSSENKNHVYNLECGSDPGSGIVLYLTYFPIRFLTPSLSYIYNDTDPQANDKSCNVVVAVEMVVAVYTECFSIKLNSSPT